MKLADKVRKDAIEELEALKQAENLVGEIKKEVEKAKKAKKEFASLKTFQSRVIYLTIQMLVEEGFDAQFDSDCSDELMVSWP